MYCKKCGFYINDATQKFCGHCGASIEESTVVSTTNNVNNINVEQQSQKFLIIGIVMAFCCSLPFGVAIVLINELKYKKELREGKVIEAEKTKKLMTALIIVGIVFGILGGTLSFFLELLTAFE